MKKVILDTNGYTKLLLGEKSVLETLAQAERVFMPTIVLGELFAGFRGGSKEAKNKKILEQFLAKPMVEIVPIGKETAEIFGQIKYHLQKNGTPVPINDIWIACCAIEVGAVIITFDSHFLKIPQVRVWGKV